MNYILTSRIVVPFLYLNKIQALYISSYKISLKSTEFHRKYCHLSNTPKKAKLKMFAYST